MIYIILTVTLAQPSQLLPPPSIWDILPYKERKREKEVKLALAVATLKYQTPSQWLSPLEFPEGMTKYKTEKYTQSIFVRNGWNNIDRVLIKPSSLEDKWKLSGGMEGLTQWKSEKYKLIPNGQRTVSWLGPIRVWNGVNYQYNKGINRIYPDGTRFDDVLSSNGEVFEHRSREKVDGQWKSRILYRNRKSRPQGYTPLEVTCASCHNQAGTGGYGEGLIPGGDTVFSDPINWSLWGY